MRGAARTQGSQDTSSEGESYMGLLDSLKGRGYLDTTPGTSNRSQLGAGAGIWTPEVYSAATPAPHVAHVDTSAARAAAFGRAKDQVGQTSSGSIAALRSVLGGRGMLGSGAESRGAASVINAGQGQLGDVSRQGAITDAGAATREAEINQNADVAQRAQDMAAVNERNSGRLAARGQDLSFAESGLNRSTAANSARMQAILGLFSAFRNGRY